MIKHKKIILGLIVSFIIIVSLVVFDFGTNAYVLQNKKSSIKNNNMISILLENQAGSGEYSSSSNNSWPTSGYEFNSELSRCVNGGTLTWDSTNNKVMFDGEASDKCYVYFNKIMTASDYIKKLYTGIQGENNLYYHDSTLTNGAGDNSYRFAGSNESVNNFVCFGYDSIDGSCPTDYLYRIIGVFDDQIKLIKYDYAKADLLGKNGDYYNTYSGWEGTSNNGTSKGEVSKTDIGVYYWNYKNDTTINNGHGSDDWTTSLLNKVNLNTNFINNVGGKWNSKIVTHTWIVGGNAWDAIGSVVVSTSYQNEIVNPRNDTTYDSKIGLMYISDYGYASNPSLWTIGLSSLDYMSKVKKNNWMYMGLYDWTITPVSAGAIYVMGDGVTHDGYTSLTRAVRPVFYLNSDVLFADGNGTISKPFLIN